MKELILEKLKNENKALSLIDINNVLGLTTVEEYQTLQKEVNALVSEGKIHRTKKDKYVLMDNCSSLFSGVVHINKRGNGFVTIKDSEDIFVKKENLNNAIDGDLVEVDVQGEDGIIVNVLKRDLSVLVGEIVMKRNNLCFVLDDDKKNIGVEVTEESLTHCVEGHKVLVKIIKELRTNYYLGKVIKILGHKNDPGVDIMSIACEHGIIIDFPEAIDYELQSIPNVVKEKELKDRKDLRKEVIFTIDGDDTKDIDDAISIKKDNNNYILGVHIADVSHYVTERTLLFDSAYQRGTSSYLADTVIPMLPHELSNGICSLNEGADRLTITCEMTINTEGKVIDHDIFLSAIKSKKKMTYKNVNSILYDNGIPEGYEAFVDDLKLMQELAHILRKRKENKGYIDFGLDEAKIIQDKNGKAINVVKREQLEGEKLIEDFMIAANETVAEHIANMELPFVYRVHGEPSSEKITDFVNLLKMLNCSVNVNLNNISPKTMQELLNSLKGHKDFEILSDMLLRSMKKAIYSTNNIGHFGLASKMYTHFTSPIRRFPDLVVHTLLHKYLFECKIDRDTINYYGGLLPTYCEKASEREQAAIEAERDVLEMKMAEYMESHVGEVYEGIISGVTNFGFFVKLPNLVEGLVHISSLNGFYNYVPELLSLVQDNKIKYTLGDKIRIKVVGASKKEKTIDFELDGEKNGNKQ